MSFLNLRYQRLRGKSWQGNENTLARFGTIKAGSGMVIVIFSCKFFVMFILFARDTLQMEQRLASQFTETKYYAR